MPDEVIPVPEDKLILVVPGFHQKPQRNQTLEQITRHLSVFLGCPEGAPVNVAGYAGKQIATESKRATTYHLFELYWQDLGTQLSDEKIHVQLLRGLGLLLS